MNPRTPSMTERVARAIAAAMGEEDWRPFVTAARAAVTAMREPTPDMLEAALPDSPDWGYLPDDWRAMIDHVAGEKVFPAAFNS
ncbi:MAG TPA: hypothetical protein P5337_09250 [Aestuariivirga sp.]|nr:hypothetical protein [Alphaproteobacteria bacterium]HRX36572.1 hypothetical protein [Aestuariivirga sp.]